MDFSLLEKPLLHVWGHDVSFLGLIAFVIWFAVGLAMSRVLQHDIIRRLLSRLKIEGNLIAIITTILSLAVLVFFFITAVNAAGPFFLSHTVLRGRYTLRVAIGNLRTTRRHLDELWRLLCRCAGELAAAPVAVSQPTGGGGAPRTTAS